MFTRECPDCKKELKYKSKKAKVSAENRGGKCSSCALKGKPKSPEHVKKVSEGKKGKSWKAMVLAKPDGEAILKDHAEKSRARGLTSNPMKGKSWVDHVKAKHGEAADKVLKEHHRRSREQNGMKGRSLYSVWCDKYGPEEAGRRQAELNLKRSRNASGSKNPMYGKPSPLKSGNGTGWCYRGGYFRSILELSYLVSLVSQGVEWEYAEKFPGIPYTHEGVARTYRPDFKVGEVWVEVKPRALVNTKENQSKWAAAESLWGDNFRVVTSTDIKRLTKQQVQELVDCGEVTLSS